MDENISINLDEKSCLICLESEGYIYNKKKYYSCNCNILFHEKCFDDYIKNYNNCPICKKIKINMSFKYLIEKIIQNEDRRNIAFKNILSGFKLFTFILNFIQVYLFFLFFLNIPYSDKIQYFLFYFFLAMSIPISIGNILFYVIIDCFKIYNLNGILTNLYLRNFLYIPYIIWEFLNSVAIYFSFFFISVNTIIFYGIIVFTINICIKIMILILHILV
jgi:hypothetical protein